MDCYGLDYLFGNSRILRLGLEIFVEAHANGSQDMKFVQCRMNDTNNHTLLIASKIFVILSFAVVLVTNTKKLSLL